MKIKLKMKNKMNKKGDLPVTILVIGVLAICTLAIVSFYLADRDVKKDFIVIGAVEEASVLGEKAAFYSREEIGFSQEEADEIMGIETDIQGRHIEIKRMGISVRYNLP